MAKDVFPCFCVGEVEKVRGDTHDGAVIFVEVLVEEGLDAADVGYCPGDFGRPVEDGAGEVAEGVEEDVVYA